MKSSGVGREEELDELLSYTQVKNIHVRYPADTPAPVVDDAAIELPN